MIVLGSIFISCKNDRESKPQYYPIRFFIEKELAIIDSFHIPITRYEVNSTGSNSSIMNITAFRGVVNELLLNNLSTTDALDDYKETTINDLSLNFITLSYTDPEKNITKIDLHIDPQTEKVKSLYAEKTDKKNDSLITRKILLTSGSQLLINTIISTNNNVEKRTERYNWSLNHPK
jgi:hypothetical protein